MVVLYCLLEVIARLPIGGVQYSKFLAVRVRIWLSRDFLVINERIVVTCKVPRGCWEHALSSFYLDIVVNQVSDRQCCGCFQLQMRVHVLALLRRIVWTMK